MILLVCSGNRENKLEKSEMISAIIPKSIEIEDYIRGKGGMNCIFAKISCKEKTTSLNDSGFYYFLLLVFR